DLGNRVWFVRWLQWAAKQRAFGNRLRRELWVNARTTKEKQLADTELISKANHVVLDQQVIEQESDWMIVVRLDPADLRCGENNYGWIFNLKEGRDCGFIIQVKRAVGDEQIGETFRFETSNERAANHSAMAGNEDFVG